MRAIGDSTINNHFDGYFIRISVVKDMKIAINMWSECEALHLRPHGDLMPVPHTQISNGIQLIKSNYEMNTKLRFRTDPPGCSHIKIT